MTQEKNNQLIKELKKLNGAYIAALEYDYCPEPKKAKEVSDMFETGLSLKELKEAFADNSGRRPDEIANEISEVIKGL